MKTNTNLRGSGLLFLVLLFFSSCGSAIFVANFESDNNNQIPNAFPTGAPNNDRIEFPDDFEPFMRVYAWPSGGTNPVLKTKSLRLYKSDLDPDMNRISSMKLIPTRRAMDKKSYSVSYVVLNDYHGDQYANEFETHVMATSDGAPAVSVVLRDRLKLFVNGVEVHRWADPYGAGSLYIYISISKENGNFRVGYKHTRTGSYTYTEYMPLPAPFNTLDHVLMRYSTPGLSQGEDRFASFFIDQIVIRDYK